MTLAKAATILGLTVLVSVGLCGLGIAYPAGQGYFNSYLMAAGILGFWGGLLGLLIVALIELGKLIFLGHENPNALIDSQGSDLARDAIENDKDKP